MKNYFNKFSKYLKKRFSFISVIIIVVFTFFVGVVFGCFISLATSSILGVKLDEPLSEFLSTYSLVSEDYYEDVDNKKIIDSAINGMLSALGDDYSYFMDQDSTADFNKTMDGKYLGIGITISYYEGVTTIIDVAKNSPAMKAGLEIDDIIVGVNDKDVTDKDSSYIVNLVTGDVGKKVKIEVKRKDENLIFNLKIAEIEIQSVHSELKEENDKKIGYLQIDTFAANTYDQFEKNLLKLEKKNIDSLIIDVRNNSGGHLSQVKSILELFFKKNVVLYNMDNKNKVTPIKSTTSDNRTYPVVVLVNSGSASASEVLASCFSEKYDKATIIGTTTYGKGTVQATVGLSKGTSLKLTTQKWLTSKGQWINKKGIDPDIEVINEIDSEEDKQLQKAIEILIK